MDKFLTFSDITWSPISKYRGRGVWQCVRKERSKINDLENIWIKKSCSLI